MRNMEETTDIQMTDEDLVADFEGEIIDDVLYITKVYCGYSTFVKFIAHNLDKIVFVGSDRSVKQYESTLFGYNYVIGSAFYNGLILCAYTMNMHKNKILNFTAYSPFS